MHHPRYSKCQEIIASSLAFAVLGTDATATAWGDASHGGDASAVTLTDIEFIYANTYAFVALSLHAADGGTGDYRSVITWGDQTYGGNFIEGRMLRTDYVYGNEMFRQNSMTDPTPAPTGMPSKTPTGQPTTEPSGQPSTQPTKVTASPSGEPSGQPSGEPSSAPTDVSAPVLSGVFASNYTYYCRPFHVNTTAPNGTSYMCDATPTPRDIMCLTCLSFVGLLLLLPSLILSDSFFYLSISLSPAHISCYVML
jgi:hypothetical protein